MSARRGVAVVTDSTATCRPSWSAEHGIEVVPLQVVIGGTSYDEGTERVGRHGRRRPAPLAAGHHLATRRRRPSSQAYQRGGRARLRRGGVGAPVGADVRAPSSRRGWRPRSRRCPPRSSTPRSLGMGLGFAVRVRGGRGRARDGPATRSPRRRGDARPRSTAVFYVDTLEHLRRGGRIGAAAALLGSALAVKPLLHLVDGHIEPLEKVRTAAKAIARLEEVAVAAGRAAGRCDMAVHHLAERRAGRGAGRPAAPPAARDSAGCTSARSARWSARTSGPACSPWSSPRADAPGPSSTGDRPSSSTDRSRGARVHAAGFLASDG